jgi:hypothetical protein
LFGCPTLRCWRVGLLHPKWFRAASHLHLLLHLLLQDLHLQSPTTGAILGSRRRQGFNANWRNPTQIGDSIRHYPFPPLMLIRAAANCALPHLRLCAPSNDCFFPGMSHLLSELAIVIALVETNIALRSPQVAGRQQLNYRKMCKVQFPVPPLLYYSSSLLFT